MTGLLIIISLVMVWALAIRLITVRRLRAKAGNEQGSSIRPTQEDYEKSLKWFSEVLEPHLMFLAVVVLGIFTYRLAQNQNTMLERQVAMDESRQPVTFSFVRTEGYIPETDQATENIMVSANDGYIANLRFDIKNYLSLDLLRRPTLDGSYIIERRLTVGVEGFFDIERVLGDASPNMIWSSEDRFQELYSLVDDAYAHLEDMHGQAISGHSRRMDIAVSYTAFDLDEHTDYYSMAWLNRGEQSANEPVRAFRTSAEFWDNHWGASESISFWFDWESNADKLHTLIDERMNVPVSTPSDM